MARYQRQNLTAFAGMDTSSDPAEVAMDRALLLDGFLPGRQGQLQNFPQYKNVFLPTYLPLGEFPEQITTQVFYQGYRTSTLNVPDVMLLFTTARNVYTMSLTYIAAGFLGNGQYVLGSPVFVGQLPIRNTAYTSAAIRCRTCQYNDETFIVRQDGIQPYRFTYETSTGTPVPRLFQVGLPAPTITSITDGGAGTGIFANGDIRAYVIVWLDEKLRESSISAVVTHTSATALCNFNVHFTSPNDSTLAIRYYRVYCTKISSLGSGAFYLNAGSSGTVTEIPALPNGTAYTFTDSVTDAQLLDTTAAAAGDNDQPQPASICTIFKSRLTLDKISNRTSVQLSNFDAPTQFAQFASPYVDADANLGTTVTVGGDRGEEVTGLMTFGALLVVFKRRSVHQVDGDDLLTGFISRQIHARGCLSPDSVTHCDNVVMFLSDDNIYGISYLDGLSIKIMSNDIQDQFSGSFPNSVTGATSFGTTLMDTEKPNAHGFYWENRYFFCIGTYTYCYDFQTGGWSRTTNYIYTATVIQQTGCPQTVFLSASYIYFGYRGYCFFWNRVNTDTTDYHPPFGSTYTASRIVTRPADGTNVPRERLKRVKRVTVRGTNGYNGTAGAPMATVLLKAVGTPGTDYTEPYTIVRNVGQYPDDTLFFIEPTPAMQGRLLEMDATIQAVGLTVNEVLFEYIPVNG